jgi:hypothetical protein
VFATSFISAWKFWMVQEHRFSRLSLAHMGRATLFMSKIFPPSLETRE